MSVSFLPSHQALPDGHVNGAQMAALTGITYRRIDFWTRAGYLAPTAASPGSGHQRVYPASEVTIALLMVRLVDDGLTPSAAAECARELATTGTTRIAGIPIHLPQEL